jgi:RNA polymerase sigma-70 factor (ECF subfamily)
MTRDAYNQLFEESYNSLCKYAYTIVKDYDDAEDIVQGVFISFWNNEKKEEIGDKVKNYLLRSVKFKCIDLHRKKLLHRNFEQEVMHTQEKIVQIDFNEEKDTNIKDVLMLAISELPEKTREVFMACKLDGLSYNEIASHYEISPKTVENQMGRAFRHLREKLQHYKELLIFILFFLFE